MNPYATQLGVEDPIAVIGKTAERLAAAIRSKGADGVERPIAPGKWSPRQIAAHLADCEVAFGWRIRQTLAEDRPVLQPFDQDKWAAHYDVYSAEASLSAFTAMRAFNAALIGSLNAADLAREATHPERGTMTLRTILETMAGHDLNHLKQLEA